MLILYQLLVIIILSVVMLKLFDILTGLYSTGCIDCQLKWSQYIYIYTSIYIQFYSWSMVKFIASVLFLFCFLTGRKMKLISMLHIWKLEILFIYIFSKQNSPVSHCAINVTPQWSIVAQIDNVRLFLNLILSVASSRVIGYQQPFMINLKL